MQAHMHHHPHRRIPAGYGTGRPLTASGLEAHSGSDYDEWQLPHQHQNQQRPPNAANMQHTVDFRRPWVPSPELRGLFPLGSSSLRAPQAQMYPAHTHTHAHTPRPVLPPPAPAPARAMRRRAHGSGDEEKRAEGRVQQHRHSLSYSQPARGNDNSLFLSSFAARTRPRAATVTGAGTAAVAGDGHGLGMVNGAAMGNGSAMGMGTGAGMAMGGGGQLGLGVADTPASRRSAARQSSLHIAGGPREQAPDPEAREGWARRSARRESQGQRARHVRGRGREADPELEPEPEPEPESATSLRRSVISTLSPSRRRSAAITTVNGSGGGGGNGGRDRPKSWLSLLHPKRLFSACAFFSAFSSFVPHTSGARASSLTVRAPRAPEEFEWCC